MLGQVCSSAFEILGTGTLLKDLLGSLQSLFKKKIIRQCLSFFEIPLHLILC